MKYIEISKYSTETSDIIISALEIPGCGCIIRTNESGRLDNVFVPNAKICQGEDGPWVGKIEGFMEAVKQSPFLTFREPEDDLYKMTELTYEKIFQPGDPFPPVGSKRLVFSGEKIVEAALIDTGGPVPSLWRDAEGMVVHPRSFFEPGIKIPDIGVRVFINTFDGPVIAKRVLLFKKGAWVWDVNGDHKSQSYPLKFPR